MKQAILNVCNTKTNDVKKESQHITNENFDEERTATIITAKTLLEQIQDSLAPYENEYHNSEEKINLKVNKIEQNKNKTTITSAKPIKVVENIYYFK